VARRDFVIIRSKVSPDEYQWVTSVFPDGSPFDPESPAYTEEAYEKMSPSENSFFSKGLTTLKDWFLKRRNH
jgi:hypothetical protein